MKRISIADLRGACDDQLAEFRRRFPDGVTFSSEEDAVAQCRAVGNVFYWEWAARRLLSAPAWEAYRQAMASAFAIAFWRDKPPGDAGRTETEAIADLKEQLEEDAA